MKTQIASTLLLAAALTTGATLGAADAPSDNVTVSFHESDKFTDARSHWGGETDRHYLDTLAKHLKATAAKQLAPGQKLEVTFTDVDLAGDFIPGDARRQDVRVIKEIYIPRQHLTFRVIDAEGRVVKDGERRLSDINFMNNISLVGRNEPLFYDKELLSAWLNKELRS